VLKPRTVSGVPTLILRGTHGGTFAVPREWTDRAEPGSVSEDAVIDARRLPALLDLAGQLRSAAREKSGKRKRKKRVDR